MFPGFHDGQGFFGGVDVEINAHHAVVEFAHQLVPGVREHAEHFAVLRQDLGHEAADAVLPGGRSQVFEQDGADAPALLDIGNIEGDFGLGRVIQPVVAADADDLSTDGDDERHPVFMVHFGEAVQFLGGESRFEREEPHIDGGLGLRRVESLERVGIPG